MLREILKIMRNYLRDPQYREWLRVKRDCRRAGPGNPLVTHIAGFRIKGSESSALLHLYEEIFLQRAFDCSFEKNDPLIICCGANIGLEIFRLKKSYPDARITAIEADPAIAGILQENIRSNAISNTTVIAAAAWIEETILSFRSDGALGGKTGPGQTEVPAIRLADLLRRETTIDLLLLDIEGAEMSVLGDCQAELSRVKRLFVEWHGPENENQQLPGLLNLLSAAGFRYRLYNKPGKAPFSNRIIENGFDAMVEIYAEKS